MATFEKYAPEMQKLWDTMKIIRDANSLNAMANRVKQHKAVYQAVERDTGVPWQMVAVIHIREAGLGDVGVWKGVLHNGEKIVGTGKRTRLVPAGLGPFNDWHSAAVHALRLKKFHLIKTWTPGMMCAAMEPFNGYGYRNLGLRTPYVWASTNHQQPGKYVRDHVFDANVMDTQMGCAAMLKYLGVGSNVVVDIVRDTVIVTGPIAPVAYTYPEWIVPLVILGGIAIAGIIIYRIKNK